VLVTEEWTSENGLLTAAMKVKRQDVKKKYARELQVMYSGK